MNAKDPGKWSLLGAINILEDNEQCHRTPHSTPSGRYEVWRGGNKPQDRASSHIAWLPSRCSEPASLQWCSLSPLSSQLHPSFLLVSIFLFLSCLLSFSSQYVAHAGPEILLLPPTECWDPRHMPPLPGWPLLSFFVNDHLKALDSLTPCLELTYLATLAAKEAENVVFVLDGPVSINQAKQVDGYWEVSDIFYPSVNARKFTLENYTIRLKLNFLK